LLAIFLGLAVVSRGGPLPGEERLEHLLQQRMPARSVWLGLVASAPVWDSLVLVLAVLLWRRGQGRTGALLLGAVVSAEVLTIVAKDLIDRQAPGSIPSTEPLLRAGDVLFPSAHVVRTTVTLCIAFARTPWLHGPWRAVFLAASFGFLALLGLVQASFGGHLPLDVVGGYSLGAAWASILLLVAALPERRVDIVAADAHTGRAFDKLRHTG
jgi:undecaprenyl-diphosphatase